MKKITKVVLIVLAVLLAGFLVLGMIGSYMEYGNVWTLFQEAWKNA